MIYEKKAPVQLLLDIPLEMISWNTILGRASHWKIKRENEKWLKAVFVYYNIAKGAGKIKRDFIFALGKPMKVTILSYRAYGKRLYDNDNLCKKPILDALRKCEIIKNDSEKWLLPTEVKQFKCKADEQAHTIIIIEEAKER